MRFMMLVKASKDCEAGVLPDEKILSEIGNYNEESGQGRRAARGRRAPGEFQGHARSVFQRKV